MKKQQLESTAKPETSDINLLRIRLAEAEDTLEAIRQGSVDALVIRENDKQEIFTLKSADRTYRVLIESMSQGAMTIANNGTILYANSQFSRITNTPLEKIIGTNIQSFFNEKDRENIDKIVKQKQKRSANVAQNELELEIPGKAYLAVKLSATHLPQTETNAYMGIVITDISEQKKAEQAKDEFISLASHQLRTPATAVKQYLGMLIEGYAGDLDEQLLVYIRTANDNNEKQLQVINSILKTAKIDSGVYEVNKTNQNLLAIINDVIKDFKPITLMRKQKLVCNVSQDISVNAEKSELSIALSNLIENASKYSTSDSTITVDAKVKTRSVVIRVIDEGVGIAPADQIKIFEKFTRIDNELSDTISGSGLGLYWTKKIITVHGGTILVKSKLGKGTTFTIELPL